MVRPRRSKRRASRPVHLRGPKDEGWHGDPGIRFRRGYARDHAYESPEQLLIKVCQGMEGWARKKKGCPKSVTDALPFARWTPCLPSIGGDEELDAKGDQPVEYRLSIQLVHPGKVVPGRRLTGVSIFDWLSVKESELPGAGMGLFAGRHFDKNALITAYVGVMTRPGGDITRKVNFTGATIDVPVTTKMRFFGAHFINNPYWGMFPWQRNEYELGPGGKKHNAMWDGLGIRASKEIRKGDEILLDYKPDDRTAATERELEKRAREIKAKRKREE